MITFAVVLAKQESLASQLQYPIGNQR